MAVGSSSRLEEVRGADRRTSYLCGGGEELAAEWKAVWGGWGRSGGGAVRRAVLGLWQGRDGSAGGCVHFGEGRERFKSVGGRGEEVVRVEAVQLVAVEEEGIPEEEGLGVREMVGRGDGERGGDGEKGWRERKGGREKG